MPNILLLCGPPGSGKSTIAKNFIYENTVYVNQDSQAKEGHWKIFQNALENNKDIVVDRMSFSKEQRERYLLPAKIKNYQSKILVVHESFKTCFDRCIARTNHETIKDEKDASKALNFFFTKYERVEDSEADEVVRLWPKDPKPKVVVFDIDGTMANIDHRLKYVKTDGKKDWKNFFGELKNDKINEWCRDLLNILDTKYQTVFCSGRPDDHRQATVDWLNANDIYPFMYQHLFMRRRGDFRQDYIIKEVILDFELLTRYDVHMIIDDRQQVVDMYRNRGYTVLQCAKGEF